MDRQTEIELGALADMTQALERKLGSVEAAATLVAAEHLAFQLRQLREVVESEE